MSRLLSHLVRFRNGEDGHAAVEYVVVLAFIVCAILGAVYHIGQQLGGK